MGNEEGQAASKREKFVRLAERRTVKAIEAIRAIGKLNSRSTYDYTDADVAKIVRRLNGEVKAVKDRLANPGKAEATEFRL